MEVCIPGRRGAVAVVCEGAWGRLGGRQGPWGQFRASAEDCCADTRYGWRFSCGRRKQTWPCRVACGSAGVCVVSSGLSLGLSVAASEPAFCHLHVRRCAGLAECVALLCNYIACLSQIN